MIHYFLDFETRSRSDVEGIGHGEYLKKVGVHKYADNPDTEVLCMAYSKNGEEPKLWIPGDEPPKHLVSAIERRAVVLHAYNAAFEHTIWNKKLISAGFPKVPVELWECTMARCSHAAMNRSLEGASVSLGLGTTKDKEGKRIMMRLCKPRKPTKNDPREWFDDKEDFEKLYEYCKQDVRTEIAIYRATPDLSPGEQEMWVLDQKINERGIPIDRELAEKAIELQEKYNESLIDELREVTKGEVETGKQIDKMMKFLHNEGCNIENLKKPSVQAALEEEDLSTPARRVLEIRQKLGGTATTKYNALLVSESEDRTVKGCLNYYGAERTGRWSGRRFQPQNIARGSLSGRMLPPAIKAIKEGWDVEDYKIVFGSVPGMLASCVRPTVYCGEDQELTIVDYSGIEARVVAWLAGQQDLLNMFEAGEDIYVDMASEIYKRPITKADKNERFIGKSTVLGCGYQMGKDLFLANTTKLCKAYGIDLVIDIEMAEKAVDAYREKYSRIKDLWGACGKAAVECVKTRKPMKVGKLRFRMLDHWLTIKLPSGRRLFYPFAGTETVIKKYFDTKKDEWVTYLADQVTYMGIDQYTGRWGALSTYGGKLVENATQAVARDLLANALKWLDREGLNVIMHVHDEVVVQALRGEVTLAQVEEIMCRKPKWADGLPIAVEGFQWNRFRK